MQTGELITKMWKHPHVQKAYDKRNEFQLNDSAYYYLNDRLHEKGVLSMARSADPDSAGSQFFVCLGRDKCQHLDGQYTAFGKVVDGLDVVDAIAAVEIDPHSGAPTGDMPRMTGGIRPVVAS